MNAPKVFISYSHDSDAHKRWVLKLANDLRSKGIDTNLDQWLPIGSDLGSFMHQGIASSDRVLMICTEHYVQKAEAGRGGVGFEKLVVTGEVVKSIDTVKFVPVCRGSTDQSRIPNFLGARLYIDFDDDALYERKLSELVREIHGVPESEKAPLGANPFSASHPAHIELTETANLAGTTADGKSTLDAAWFGHHELQALSGSTSLGVQGLMELRFALLEPLRKSQIELLSSVRSSTVRYFGWPIPIVIENREEYKPRPLADGIKAEVAINEEGGRYSYDYWAASNSGRFYMLQSLFEDSRTKGEIFFNTRIVRVTESLMFAFKFYDNLGVTHDRGVAIRVSHSGLKGRKLTSSGNRLMMEHPTSTEESMYSEIVLKLGELQDHLPDRVMKLLAPMFLLFDFQEFNERIYSDIVEKFQVGQVT